MAYYLHQVAFTSDAWAKMAKQPQNREAMRPVMVKTTPFINVEEAK